MDFHFIKTPLFLTNLEQDQINEKINWNILQELESVPLFAAY